MGKYQPKDGPYWISPCERPDCPDAAKGWHAHAEDVDGVQIPDEVAEEIAAESVVIPGPIVSDDAYRTVGPPPVTPAAPTIADHFDASAYDNEFACACGAEFDDLNALKSHISEEI